MPKDIAVSKIVRNKEGRVTGLEPSEFACPHCGGHINPASMMGAKKKTMTDAAVAQRQKANAARWKDHKKKLSSK